jgi:tRNA 2-thiouridine synthesizing protein E
MYSIETEATESIPSGAPLFDEDGYLLDHRLWSEQLGRDLAEEEGVGALTDKHWRVLRHVREKFLRIGALPNMRRVCRETQLSKTEIYGLFGGCLVIWRVAGLPNPGEEAKAYLI